MQKHNNDVSFVINVHERLVRDFPSTPYINWCRWVHNQPFNPLEKWSRLLAWDLNPREYDNPQLFRYDWQAFKLLSKLSVGETIDERSKEAAYRKFRDSEARCLALNEQWSVSIPTHTAQLLHGMKNIIASVVGTTDDFFQWLCKQPIEDKTLLIDQFNGKYSNDYLSPSRYTYTSVVPEFGPGVSVGSCGDKLSTYSEKVVLGTCTPQSINFVDCVRKLWEGVFVETPHGVRGSVLTFVPKRVGEARAICYEPSMNMLVQKLIGKYFKFRLKTKLGIDLSNQERNRSLAELGSLCDSYCTVDLSSASDLNSISLVLNLFAPSWFNLLDAIRSKEYFDQDTNEWNTFHKFSTMGNGFTFELETLIFASIVKTTVDLHCDTPVSWREISVYGDDLIFPKQFFDCVNHALLLCGHIPNTEKSFAHGPFRESCGGDFFKGWNVTPCKIKEVSLNDPQSIVNIYNQLYISSGRMFNMHSFSDRFDRALQYIRKWLIQHHPRISEGTIEWGSFSHTMRTFALQPSNEFLWASEPTLNSAFSSSLQRILPRWCLLKRKQPITRGGISCCYDLDERMVIYHIHQNTGDRILRESVNTCVFRRNVELFGYGKRRK